MSTINKRNKPGINKLKIQFIKEKITINSKVASETGTEIKAAIIVKKNGAVKEKPFSLHNRKCTVRASTSRKRELMGVPAPG